MNFIDNNGHIFAIESSSEPVIGYAYEENPYIFWLNNADTDNMSINNYYTRVINFLIPLYDEQTIQDYSDKVGITITLDSHIYSFISTAKLHDLLYNNASFKDTVEMNVNDCIQKITDEDMLTVIVDVDGKKQLIVPVYVVGNADTEGTWISNALIHVYNKTEEYDVVNETYCSISIGGTYVDDSEPLIINGKNMGIDLPKDILRSVYKQSFISDSFNHKLYNDKLKEYLLNYIVLKGQTGNFNSAIKSLQWFGWGDKLTISKLLQTDNQFQNQFIRNYFDISYDILESYKTFRNSTYISISLKLNEETGNLYPFDFTEDFYGENNPELENLLDKSLYVKDDINESLYYIKSYYDYAFNELGLKLACLKYFYSKYFLPVHLSVNNISTEHKVYMNDIKFINKHNTSLTAYPVLTGNTSPEIELPKNHILYLTKQIHYIDSNYNEFNTYNEEGTWYYINDTCVNIPVKFLNNKYYNCVFILSKENKVYDDNYVVSLYDTCINYNDKITVYDRNNKLINLDDYKFAYSADNKLFSPYVNGYSQLKEKLKEINKNEYLVETDEEGNLKTSYLDYSITVTENAQYIPYQDDIIYVPAAKEIGKNQITGKMYIYLSVINPYYIKFKYTDSELKNVYINDIAVNNIFINFLPSSEVVFERHFNFYQDENIKHTQYHNFVIYPKMFNQNKDINYWVDSDFTLRMLINDKWYTYEFKLKIPEPDIHFGKLKYKYWADKNNIYTKFNQVKDICYVDGKEQVMFNSYMYNPELVTINHINFYDDYIKYSINNDITYIDDTYIDENTFYYYITVYDTILRFNDNIYGKNIIITADSVKHDCIYLTNIDNTQYKIYKSGISYKIEKIDDSKDKMIFWFDKETNSYYMDNVYYPIYESNHYGLNILLDKYFPKINLSNHSKYLNSVHLYNLSKKSCEGNNILYFHNDIYLISDNMLFTYNKYYDKNRNKSNRIFINGNIFKDVMTTENDLQPYSIWYNEHHNISEIIYGFYYIVDKEGNVTDKTTDEMYSEYYGGTTPYGAGYYLSFNDFKNGKYISKTFNTDLVYDEITINDKKYSMYIASNDPDKTDKYPVTFNIHYEKYDTELQKYVEYIPLNSEYKDFVTKMAGNSNMMYRLRVNFSITDTVKISNRLMLVADNIISPVNLNTNNIIFAEILEDDFKQKYIISDDKRINLFEIRFPHYYDNIRNMIIPYNSPGMHWFDMDDLIESDGQPWDSENQYVMLHTETDDEELLLAELDKQYNSDNGQAKHLYDFINYLSKTIYVKDFIGKENYIKCKFRYTASTPDINVILSVHHNDETPDDIYDMHDCDFIINKEDEYIHLYIQVKAGSTDYENAWVEPYIELYEDTLMPYRYNHDDANNIKIKINGKEYIYNDNSSAEVVNLYKDFFHEINYDIDGHTIRYFDSNVNLNKYLDYDFYLMHDMTCWYGLFISKQTINYARNLDDLIIKENEKHINVETDNTTYTLDYVRSSNNFLINRMMYIPANGYNHFEKDDLIVCKIENNDRLPVNIFNGTKWNISPMSIGLNNSMDISSNNEMTILGLPYNNTQYIKGYYNTTVRYSIDGVTNQQFMNETKIKIS